MGPWSLGPLFIPTHLYCMEVLPSHPFMSVTCRPPSGNEPQEDIFECLLGSPDTAPDQNSPQSINVKSYCTVITQFNGYVSVCNSSEYSHTFTILSEFYYSSMLVIHSSCCKADSPGTLVDDHLLVSFFGPDVALYKSPLLLYGTSAGQIFYVPLSVHNFNSCSNELRSHLLLSLGQAILNIFLVRLCDNYCEFVSFCWKRW